MKLELNIKRADLGFPFSDSEVVSHFRTQQLQGAKAEGRQSSKSGRRFQDTWSSHDMRAGYENDFGRTNAGLVVTTILVTTLLSLVATLPLPINLVTTLLLLSYFAFVTKYPFLSHRQLVFSCSFGLDLIIQKFPMNKH